MVLAAGSAEAAPPVADPCGRLARSIERQERMPPGLVQAVALAESGRWLAETRQRIAWPWTVTSGSDSYYLPTKQAALAKVRELRAQGRTNIDVGCMQVNLGYHGHAFASLEGALEPAVNVAYGARFLRELRAETRSWGRATAHYHSRTPKRGEAYRTKVYRLWREVRRGKGGAPLQLARAPGAILRGGRLEMGTSDQRPPLEIGVEPAPPGAVPVLRGSRRMRLQIGGS